MLRLKRRGRIMRDCGPHHRRDTPIKRGTSVQRRLLPIKYYETLSEEPVDESEQVLTDKKPENPLHPHSPAFPETSRGEKHLTATPAHRRAGYRLSMWDPATRMTPDPEAVGEEAQNVAVTPESTASPGMEQDTTVCDDGDEEEDDDDDEEDCFSTASTSSSSLPSPEIFRDENYVASLTFPTEVEVLGHHRHVNNSTLLDVSHAENIHMYQPLDLSTIRDVSIIPAEKECEIRQPEVEPKISTESLKSAPKGKTPTKISNRRPTLCKKVRFISPMVTQSVRPANISAKYPANIPVNIPIKMSSPAKQMTADVETLRVGEVIPKEDTQEEPLTVRRQKPVKRSQEQAMVFDFGDDTEEEVFFQAWRDRCARLKSIPLFPLTATRPCDVEKAEVKTSKM